MFISIFALVVVARHVVDRLEPARLRVVQLGFDAFAVLKVDAVALEVFQPFLEVGKAGIS
jgi:hypothetical protein